MTYKPYLLQDNPFPATPLLDPSSDDDRVNGKIYNPHIREAEIRSFESKIRQQLPLIYIENSVSSAVWERVHCWFSSGVSFKQRAT